MFGEIVKTLFGRKKPKKKKQSSHTEVISVREQDDALEIFLSSIKEIGHPEYQILDKEYSPSSRVPCTDLVPFISQQLYNKNINSIKAIMRGVIEGNPGLGIGSSWIDKSIDSIISVSYENYVKFIDPKGLYELKSLFIIASKNGGNSEFLITEEIPRLISWACICHEPVWSESLNNLATKANNWTAKMAEDNTYWSNYKKYEPNKIRTKQIDKSLINAISSLSPSARLQLFFAVEKGGGSLDKLTNYKIRNLGINVIQTNKELIDSKLLVFSSSKKVIENSNSKKELIELCEAYKANYKKSWKKEKLVDALQDADKSCLEEISVSKNLVEPNYQSYPSLKDIVVIADTHRENYELLCFV